MSGLTFTEYTIDTLRDSKQVPAFVLEKAKEILDMYRFEEEQWEEKLCYAETQECIDSIAESIKIWTGSCDYIIPFIYMAGASAWIQEKDLFFEGIEQSLLPAMGERDPFTWWIVSYTENENFPLIIRVKIVAPHQVLSPFPDLQ